MLASVLVLKIFVILFQPHRPVRITLPQFTVRKQAQGSHVPMASQRRDWELSPRVRTADLSRIGEQAGQCSDLAGHRSVGAGLWLVRVLPGESVLPLKLLPSHILTGWSLLYAS